MAVEQLTFPQSGDADDAEFFGGMIGQENLSNFVERGFGFSYNSAVPEVDVSQGKGYISLDQATASSSGEDVLSVNYVVQTPAQTVPLAGSALNYIYLEPNFGTDDNGNVSAYTSEQPGDALLIGTIDTSSDEVTELNRAPKVDVDRLGLGDDSNLEFGNDDDFAWRYDSTEDILLLEDDNDDRLADVSDTSLNLEIDLDLNDSAITDVNSIDGGGDRITFSDSIDLTDHSIEFDQNSGAQTLAELPVTASSSQGTEHSYNFTIDGTEVMNVYAESDGAGSIQNQTIDVSGDISDDTQTIWDTSAQEIPDSAMGTITTTTLANDDVTITAGTDLTGGGTISLGGSTTIDFSRTIGGALDINGTLNIDPTNEGNHTFTSTSSAGTYTAEYGMSDAALSISHDSSNRNITLAPNNLTTVRATPAGNLEVPNGSIRQADDTTTQIQETGTPTSWTFTGSEDRDIYQQIEIDVTNGTTGGVTEDITVELYDGTGTGGTLIVSETQSITVNAESTSRETFHVSPDYKLDSGDYHINITTSGSTLTIDWSAVDTRSATYVLEQNNSGDLLLTDHYGNTVISVDALSDNVAFIDGAVEATNGLVIPVGVDQWVPS